MGCYILHFLLFWFPEPCFYQVTTLFAALDKDGQVQDDHNEEEGQTLLNHEERDGNGIEMPTIVNMETA